MFRHQKRLFKFNFIMSSVKKFFHVFLLVSTTILLQAQSWQLKEKDSINPTGKREILTTSSLVYLVDDEALKTILWSAPHETNTRPRESNIVISVPSADGTMDSYRMVVFDMMEAPLAAQYPSIKTFYGVSVSDPTKRIRADYTDYGFRAVIYEEKGNTYIDHFQRGDRNHKIIYYKKDLQANKNNWTCEVSGEEKRHNNTGSRVTDCIFRTYRLAVATTAEYSSYHGANTSAQSSLVLSAVVVVMNRVNGVLEEDVTARLILVGNTSSIFYYDANTDPYSNGNGGAMLGQNQTTCDNVIGTSNYDIGHVFSTGGGGVAYLGSICNAGNKAGGVTGQANPIGDAFSIDYVAHEMGHQLGANHTQNNNCNRNNATAIEPGSASTIMGYAGICSPDVQAHSDAYYHAVSIAEIAAELTSNNGCNGTISFGNTKPTMAAIANYTIPKSTPFVLTASATDPENDPLKYCWEQTNNNVATMPPVSTNTVGPMFRSLIPVSSPSRYFPELATVLAGNTSSTWEVLPSVARTMAFRATVRDYHNVAGCTDEKNMTVTVASSGPFNISSQNTATSWQEGQSVTITWNVAGTTASPVSCANVNILLSYDGGNTFPVTLANFTANDGTETVIVPMGTTTVGRIMIKASNNIFYDINNSNITITANPTTFNLQLNPTASTACNSGSAQTTVTVLPVSGFNAAVTLSAINLPQGAIATFSTNPVLPNVPCTVTFSNLNSNIGLYNISIKGVSGSINKESIFALTLEGALSGPSTTSPANAASGIALFPSLTWTPVGGATSYSYELALNNGFSFVSQSGTSTNNTTEVTNHLTGGSTWYWRVRANNSCQNNSWSNVASFSTIECFYYNSSDVPKSISSTGTPVVTSSLDVYDKGTFNILDIYNVEGNHTNVDNLKFTLKHPGGNQLLFWDRPCDGEDNFDINFSDAAGNSNPCPPTDGLTYLPSNALTYFNNNTVKGKWKLQIEDLVAGDGGALTKWGMQGCFAKFCREIVEHPYPDIIGSLNGALNCADPGDTIVFSNVMQNQTIDLGNNNLVFNKSMTIIADPLLNITIASSSSSNATIEVLAGASVKIKGLKIKASLSPSGAILNAGSLTLDNTELIKNPSFSPPSLLKNTGGGTVAIEGNCNIRP